MAIFPGGFCSFTFPLNIALLVLSWINIKVTTELLCKQSESSCSNLRYDTALEKPVEHEVVVHRLRHHLLMGTNMTLCSGRWLFVAWFRQIRGKLASATSLYLNSTNAKPQERPVFLDLENTTSYSKREMLRFVIWHKNATGYIWSSPPAQSKVGDGAKLSEKGAHRLLIESVGYVGDVDHSPVTMFRHTFNGIGRTKQG